MAALIFRTHTDDITEDPGFCKHAINLCLLFICTYNITDPVSTTSASLQMRGGGWIYTRDLRGHFFFISNAPVPPSLDLYCRLSVMHDLTQRSHF